LEKVADMKKRFSVFSLVLFLVVITSIAFSQDFLKIKEKAARGDAQAQFYLGAMYYNGKGVKQDFSQAKLWLEKAAAQGDAKAKGLLNKLKSN
jgi:hypothetical protein